MKCLYRCTKNDKNKYEEISKRLSDLENNTIAVSFADVEEYNQKLAAAIIEEYYRFKIHTKLLHNYLNNLSTL